MTVPASVKLAIMTVPASANQQQEQQEQQEQPPSHNNITDSEDALLQQMLQQLTADETEVAARASYKYLVRQQQKQQQDEPLMNNAENSRSYYAKLFVRRYLRSKDGNVDKALIRVKETLKFRQDMDVDGLRTCFDPPSNSTNDTDDATAANSIEYAKRLEKEMQCQNLYVQGYDKEGRSTYIFIPRNVQGHHAEWTIKQHVYTLERALAATKSPDQTVNAMVDFSGFSLRNAPPTHIGKKFMKTLRHHYAGAIHNIYLIDAPSSFLCLWTLFKPLIGSKTRDKIHFVSSKRNGLSQFYEADHAARWMMETGEKNRQLNVQEYLYETPFDCSFDETK